jgi:hypothetical protein
MSHSRSRSRSASRPSGEFEHGKHEQHGKIGQFVHNVLHPGEHASKESDVKK